MPASNINGNFTVPCYKLIAKQRTDNTHHTTRKPDHTGMSLLAVSITSSNMFRILGGLLGELLGYAVFFSAATLLFISMLSRLRTAIFLTEATA